MHRFPVSREIQMGRIVLQMERNGLRQLSAWIGMAVQKIDGCCSDGLTAQIHFQNPFYPVCPRHLHRRTIVKHHHGIGLYVQHFLYQSILAVGKPHMASVVSLGFERIRQSREYDGVIASSGCFHCLLHQGILSLIFFYVISLGVYHIGKFSGFFQGAGHLIGMDMRTSAALIPRLFCKQPDKGGFFLRAKRQNPFIFQKHRRFFFYFLRQAVVLFPVPYSIFSVINKIKDHLQDPLHCTIQHVLGERTIFHRFHDFFIIRPAGRRHFQFQTCFQTFHTVVYRAPVGHHISFKAPLLAKHFGQKPRVLGSKGSVDLIIGTHHGFRLRLFHRRLKSRQIDLPKRLLADFGRTGHPPVFLVVGRKMFQRRAYALGLYALNMGGSHLSRQIGILGKIFKIPSAERGTLDINRRSQDHREIFRLTLISNGCPHLL